MAEMTVDGVHESMAYFYAEYGYQSLLSDSMNTLNRDVLSQYGVDDAYLWILHRYGSELFPLSQIKQSARVAHWALASLKEATAKKMHSRLFIIVRGVMIFAYEDDVKEFINNHRVSRDRWNANCPWGMEDFGYGKYMDL